MHRAFRSKLLQDKALSDKEAIETFFKRSSEEEQQGFKKRRLQLQAECQAVLDRSKRDILTFIRTVHDVRRGRGLTWTRARVF